MISKVMQAVGFILALRQAFNVLSAPVISVRSSIQIFLKKHSTTVLNGVAFQPIFMKVTAKGLCLSKILTKGYKDKKQKITQPDVFFSISVLKTFLEIHPRN